MSFPNDLFVPVPGELPGGNDYCFLGFQRLNVDIISRMQITLRSEIGATFWNISATTPTADKRIYPWLNLNDGRVYQWSYTVGKWISPRAFSFGQVLPPELNYTEQEIWSLDGGDGSDPRVTLPDGTANPYYIAKDQYTGAMWQVAHSMDGRFLLGTGNIPYTTPDNPDHTVSVAFGDSQDSDGVAGQYKHTLTEQEGGLGAHTHAYGKSYAGGSEAIWFSRPGTKTVPAYTGLEVGGGGTLNAVGNFTDADCFTLPPLDATGAVPTAAAFPLMPLYKAGWFVIPTTRAWYTING